MWDGKPTHWSIDHSLAGHTSAYWLVLVGEAHKRHTFATKDAAEIWIKQHRETMLLLNQAFSLLAVTETIVRFEEPK